MVTDGVAQTNETPIYLNKCLGMQKNKPCGEKLSSEAALEVGNLSTTLSRTAFAATLVADAKAVPASWRHSRTSIVSTSKMSNVDLSASSNPSSAASSANTTFDWSSFRVSGVKNLLFFPLLLFPYSLINYINYAVQTVLELSSITTNRLFLKIANAIMYQFCSN